MEYYNDISTALIQGKTAKIKDLIVAALGDNISAEELLEKALLHGMEIVGEKFKNNEIYVPEVMMAAKAMKTGTELLRPYMLGNVMSAKGTVVIGTVKGDMHDIGKNLVKMMIEGKGINVVDLGVNVTPEAFVDASIANKAGIICCSALLTTTMPEMKNVVNRAREAGIRDSVRIMVGGAPVTQAFCDAIGADCYTADAASAADCALRFCESN